MKKQIATSASIREGNPQTKRRCKNDEQGNSEKRRVMNGGVNYGQQVLTRQMDTELQMTKDDEVKEDRLKEEVKTEDEKEEVKREVEVEEEVGAKKPGFTQPNQNADQGKSATEPPPQPTTNNCEENMELELGLSQWGWTPWSSKEEQELWFDGDFSSGLGNPYGDYF
ncbi:gelsolin-related protein-like [Pyrus ussuriensis x Pyrus communis]|uniref:Gelsolin-related protein-like n=1 Tax=Pyrus ussuriensis x Pyrus communis TaxID=2448454 RepID=A0A5N5HWI2_9ROSA|nr:gelsolin-related protein-like [Pyrus ussuriensis x Pyrus communis]